jgi:hypothetical protein
VVTITATSASAGIAEEQAQVQTARSFSAELSGANEVPSVTTDASGSARFHLKKNEDVLRYRVRVANIEDVTMAHIHCGAVGVNGPIVAFLFGPDPAGVDPRRKLASGSILPGDIIAAPDSAACPGGIANFDELIAKIRAGATYANVHTLANPGGEIRGQIEIG